MSLSSKWLKLIFEASRLERPHIHDLLESTPSGLGMPGGPRRQRVLIVGPLAPPYGGPEKITETLLQSALFNRIFEVQHVNIRKPLTNDQRSRFRLTNVLYNLWHLWLIVWKILRHRPPVVFVFLAQNKIAFARDAVFIFTARMLGRRVVASREGAYFRTFYQQSSPLWRWCIRQTLKLPHRIRVESEMIRHQLEGAVEPGRIAVCRTGIDPGPFPLKSAPQAGTAPVRILFMANISVAKGAVDLVRALAVVKKSCATPFELRLVGDYLNDEQNITGLPNAGHAEQQIQDLLRTHRLAPHVVFPGPKYDREKLQEFMAADIFVLPSYSEGLSNAMLEALAAGLPVIVSDVGALPEGVIDGENGYLVRPGDWKDIGERLSLLISDPERRLRMGRKSREICEQKFTLDGFVTCLSKLLRVAASESLPER